MSHTEGSEGAGQGVTPAQPLSTPVGPVMADPAAWAITAFATTSFMIGMYQTGLLDGAGIAVVFPVAFFFGGLVQIIVAILEFTRGNLFAGAVFGTYGPFWVILGALNTVYPTAIPTGNAASANSLFLAMFAVITFYLAIASLRTDLVLTTIIWLIFVGLALLSAGAASGDGNVTKAGGWVVLVFAVLAWYYAAGEIIAATFGRKLLPVGPALVK